MTSACSAWVAGETSGDLIAAPVLREVQQRLGGVPGCGIGGPAMQAEGFNALWSIDDLSVRGYTEVLAALPRLLKLRSDLTRELITRNPSVFVGVDAPDFNFRLEAKLKTAGIPTIHFIGPSVWAWRRERLASIARSVNHMLLVFPFEKSLYDQAGIAATYVGHPMADEIDPGGIDKATARSKLGVSGEAPVVALLPGSRGSEIRYMGGLFFKVAKWLHSQRSTVRFLVPAATPALKLRLEQIARHEGIGDLLDLKVTDGQVRDVLAAADTVLSASGTVTLETALMQRPMVIAYRMSAISYQIMKRMAYLPYIGLPNILCDDWVVPEYVQDAASPAVLGSAILEQLDDPVACEHIVARFADLRASLASGCASRAAQVIADHAS
ncbi:MAG: lipid-A-disaccharide synthase [Burkholderiaceae bacterium]